MPRFTLSLLLGLCLASVAPAEVTSLTIIKREPFAAGKSFGDVGPYDKITAIVTFSLDPKDAHNTGIVDLDRAKTNAQGKVEFEADLVILVPHDLSKGNGTLFHDVNNRGNKLALRMFNYAPGGNDLDKDGAAGDGFLMAQGFTVVWSGWIGELLPGDGRLLLKPPVATDGGKPITGTVRFEMSSESNVKSMALSRREGHGSYNPTKDGDAKGVLTMRLKEGDERKPVARDKWKLERVPVAEVKQGVGGTLAQVRLHIDGGFEPGVLYELICECEGPIVQGAGLASVRDLISFLRYDNGQKNPLRVGGKPATKAALAFGVSQSGRFLRHFLWQGFNEDEKGRIVFDGLMPHVAGGGLGFFNSRWAQPTRHNGQHEDHLYPADMFPFAYSTLTDPLSGRTDGILKAYDKSKCMPKVMHTQTAAEYWHRSGSLVHTDPQGKKDVEIPANVRVYAFGGTQHGPASDPPSRGIAENLNNPGDYRLFLRALVLQLRAWCLENKEPAPSVYPHIADKTLVDWSQQGTGFPKLPGVRYPQVIQQPVYADYGQEPPKVHSRYTVLVPKSDADGNDLGTLLAPEVKTPLATFTGWNLRRADVGADGMLASLLGSYVPFAKTKAERTKAGDPRPSLAERYGTFEKYQSKFKEGADELQKWARPEDLQKALEDRKKSRELFAD